MTQHWQRGLGLGLALNLALGLQAAAQTGSCPPPALSQLINHRVQPGESFVTIGAQYGLAPAIVSHFNPGLSPLNPPPGRELTLPPVNGVQVNVPAGTTWQDLAAVYGVRADVLFEVNGCVAQPAAIAFIPGTHGFAAPTPAVQNYTGLSQAPLPGPLVVGLAYGWRPAPAGEERQLHSGLDLLAEPGTPVLAAEAGTVVFAGPQGDYGNLVALEHAGGWQTRYAHLATITVSPGQFVAAGHTLGTVGTTGRPDIAAPHLHFEVRSQSPIGWVAQDPALHLQLETPNRELWGTQP